MVANAELLTGSPGIAGILDRAAASAAGTQGSGHAGERQVDPDDVVSGLDGAAAATAESTPPLMAARTRILTFSGVQGAVAGPGKYWTQK